MVRSGFRYAAPRKDHARLGTLNFLLLRKGLSLQHNASPWAQTRDLGITIRSAHAGRNPKTGTDLAVPTKVTTCASTTPPVSSQLPQYSEFLDAPHLKVLLTI